MAQRATRPTAPLVIDGAACVTDPDAPDPTANLWSTVTPYGVRLLWDSVHSSDDIYGYIVERSVDGSPWVDVAGGVIVDSGAQQEPTGQIYIRPDWLDPEALPGGSLAGSTIEYRVITEDLSANRSGPSTPVLVVLP